MSNYLSELMMSRFVEYLWLAYDRNLTLFTYQAITFIHHLSRIDLPVLKGVTYVEEVYNQPTESITVIHMIYDVRCSIIITRYYNLHPRQYRTTNNTIITAAIPSLSML